MTSHVPIPFARPPAQKPANPLAALERLPGWWLGKADTRRQFAREALEKRLDKLADEHLRKASEYERKALELVPV